MPDEPQPPQSDGAGGDPFVTPPREAKAGYEARPDRATWRPDEDETTVRPEHDASHNGSGHRSPVGSLKEALHLLGELREYAGYFVSTKVTGLKSSLRSIVIYAALGIVGLAVFCGLLIAAAVYVLRGAAHGLGMLMGGRLWLGELIVGAVVLLGVAVVIVIGLKRVAGASRKRTVEQYEERQRAQRVQFGHDVEDRALERETEQRVEA